MKTVLMFICLVAPDTGKVHECATMRSVEKYATEEACRNFAVTYPPHMEKRMGAFGVPAKAVYAYECMDHDGQDSSTDIEDWDDTAATLRRDVLRRLAK